MPPRDPMTFPKGIVKLDNMNRALKESQKRPLVQYTQGGSSRSSRGAKVAGVDASVRLSKKKGSF